MVKAKEHTCITCGHSLSDADRARIRQKLFKQHLETFHGRVALAKSMIEPSREILDEVYGTPNLKEAAKAQLKEDAELLITHGKVLLGRAKKEGQDLSKLGGDIFGDHVGLPTIMLELKKAVKALNSSTIVR